MPPSEPLARPSASPVLAGVPVVGRALASIEQRLAAPNAQRLPDALADLFLAQVIDARTEDLAILAERAPADVRPMVHAPFLTRLTEEIDAGAQKADEIAATNGATARGPLAARLTHLYLPQPTTDDFTSARGFASLLARSRLDRTWRGGIKLTPIFTPDEVRAVATILLGALQTVALAVVGEHYTTQSRPQEIPPTVRDAVDKLLEAVDAGARALGVSDTLIPFALAQARMQWSVARAEGRVWLPLRAIPTAPLADADLAEHYVGRPDDDARRLGFQIRRADGALLVSGYRGVGKSSFVNRVLYHAVHDQASGESSGTTIVPVTINLAKASGVSNVLRLTLRGLRAALLNEQGEAMPIPGDAARRPLPIRPEEREHLEWAYLRSTMKVAFSRSRADESKWEVGSSIGFDPGKFAHWELGKLLSVSGSKSREEKVNRELSLLDYDENAAEEDLQNLIRRFAEPRPLYPGGPLAGMKMVFIFDELDKMDQQTGVLPLIEGLKNLFLQQHSVFVLVTSKQLYYDLLKDRAKEDATLTSYFSALVHVPLLTFEQVRRMLDDWVDSTVGGARIVRTDRESKLLDSLGRYLTYRSLGNPREIIRELRQMEQWGQPTGPSYLTDALDQSPQLAIFAAIQQCVELVAGPSTSSQALATQSGGVVLASDRLSGDEARLEQVRRGLYVMVEDLLDRQVLPLDVKALEPIQASSFTLLSTEDVLQLAQRLGDQLAIVHQYVPARIFELVGLNASVPLFRKETRTTETGVVSSIRVSNELYALTGRQAAAPVSATPADPAKRDEHELIETGEALAGKKDSWIESLAALGIMNQLEPKKWTPTLESFLLTVAQDKDPTRRAPAVDLLAKRPDIVFRDATVDLGALLSADADERTQQALIRIVGNPEGELNRKRATDALLALLDNDALVATLQGKPSVVVKARLLGDNAAIDVLSILQSVADRDIRGEVLDWLTKVQPTGAVLTAALRALTREGGARDLLDRIFGKPEYLRYFCGSSARRSSGMRFSWMALAGVAPGASSPAPSTEAAQHEAFFDELLRADVPGSAERLADHMDDADISRPLAVLLDLAFTPRNESLMQFILRRLATSEKGQTLMTKTFAAIPEFSRRVRPALEEQLNQVAADFDPEAASRVRVSMNAATEAAAAAALSAIAPSPTTSILEQMKKPGFLAGSLNLPPGIAAAAQSTKSAPRPKKRVLALRPNAAVNALKIAVGLSLIAVGMFVVGGDLPASASIAMRIWARTVSLIAPLVLGVAAFSAGSWFVSPVKTNEVVLTTPDPTRDMLRQQAPLLSLFFLYALYGGYSEKIAPVHFGTQALLFVINAVALAAIATAFKYEWI